MLTTVPVIDVAPFLEGSPAGKREVAEGMARACTDLGFFTIVGHGVPGDLADRMARVCREFFDLPLEEKVASRRPRPEQSRGYIGVAGQNTSLPRRLVRHFELPVESGVRVMSVEAGSPAHAAGVEEGDVIVQWDAVPVAGIDDLHRLLTEAYLGRSAEVTVIRRAQKLARRITPVELLAR